MPASRAKNWNGKTHTPTNYLPLGPFIGGLQNYVMTKEEALAGTGSSWQFFGNRHWQNDGNELQAGDMMDV